MTVVQKSDISDKKRIEFDLESKTDIPEITSNRRGNIIVT